MCWGADSLSLLVMSDGPRMRVIVDIERGARTVSGQITVCDGGPSDFFGWLELIDGLERAAGPIPANRERQDQTAGATTPAGA